jgi:hypothetical protein
MFKVWVKLCLSCKHTEEWGYISTHFSPQQLDGGEWFNFMPWPKRDQVDPRAGLEVLKKKKTLVQVWSQNITPYSL